MIHGYPGCKPTLHSSGQCLRGARIPQASVLRFDHARQTALPLPVLPPSAPELRDLDQAFRPWWNSKGKVRAPRFKKKHGVQSVCFTRGGFRVEDNTLRLGKVGGIPIHRSRALPSEPSGVAVIKDASGRCFASFVVDGEPPETKELPHVAQVGADLGLESLAVTSEGEKIAPLKFPCSALRRLRPLQGDLNRKVEGSSNGTKARLQVAKARAAVADRRLDFLQARHSLDAREANGVHRGSECVGDVEEPQAGPLHCGCWLANVPVLAGMQGRILRQGLACCLLMGPTSQTCSTCGHRSVNGSRTVLAAGEAERFNACGAEGGTDSPAVGRETGSP